MKYRLELDDLGPYARVTNLLGWVESGNRVLEVGCHCGDITRLLKEVKKCSVTAVEIDSEASKYASRYCVRLVVGDVQDETVWERVRRSKYDVVILADVLEHLLYPGVVLRRCVEVLRPGGCVIVSLPNIAHWTIRLSLMKGMFDYTETGILDSTHLRFYTVKTARELLMNNGLEIENMIPVNPQLPGHRLLISRVSRRLFRCDLVLQGLCLKVFPKVFALQILFRARRSQESGELCL